MLHTAIVANRTDNGRPDTEEIRRLTTAAGARVVAEITQTRPEDPGTYFGAGKIKKLADIVARTGADTVVVDGALTPSQTVALEGTVGARVIDRRRVVLEIFADGARTERAETQAELARLRYRLPRLRERADEGILNRVTESGTPLYDVRDRIDRLERRLKELPAVDERHRRARHEQGFDLVAIAGYTNAGKSTLFRRLADEMRLGETTHDDIATTARTADGLFETLETTTRRATLRGRELLMTDTVGFLEELPHWLVESFRGTLREAAVADAVLLVADVAQPVGELRRKLETARETLPNDAETVTVLNKADAVDEATLRERRSAVVDLAPDSVAISAREDNREALAPLIDRVLDALPALQRAELTLPLTGATMSLVSWLHDEATAVESDYGPDEVTLAVEADPTTVAQARHRAGELEPPS